MKYAPCQCFICNKCKGIRKWLVIECLPVIFVGTKRDPQKRSKAKIFNSAFAISARLTAFPTGMPCNSYSTWQQTFFGCMECH